MTFFPDCKVNETVDTVVDDMMDGVYPHPTNRDSVPQVIEVDLSNDLSGGDMPIVRYECGDSLSTPSDLDHIFLSH